MCIVIGRIASRSALTERRRWQRRSWRLAGIFAVTMSLASTKRGLMTTLTTTNALSSPNKIAVIGGGASGIFASIAAAEHAATVRTGNGQQQGPIKVVVLEATGKTLSKVKISGGGRCNVLHDTSKSTQTILAGYPRGQKELNGLYHKRFTPSMARDWFELRGVELKVEEDGRMFPITDSSQTIINTLMDAARDAGVDVRLKQKVSSVDVIDSAVQKDDNANNIEDQSKTFVINYKDGSREKFSSIILATGSTPAGHALAKSFGHDPLVRPVPSLFTLNCKHAVSSSSDDGLLHGLSGLSVPTGRITLRVDSPAPKHKMDDSTNGKKKKKARQIIQEGPILITHHGISGPAALRLSAFAAREFKDINYRGHVTINWDISAVSMDKSNPEQVLEELWKVTFTNPKRNVASICPLPNNAIPRRLWQALVLHSGFTADCKWGGAPKKSVRRLSQNLVACRLEITSKGTFKEEFVTAGGVDLKEINMKTMESKVCPGLFMCGEVINVDGVTGGFNFMNCWSTGYVAGESSSSRASSLL